MPYAATGRLAENPVAVDAFMRSTGDTLARVPDTAIFLTRAKDGVPPVLLWYVRHSQALQRNVLAVTLEIASTPWVDAANRIAIAEPMPGYWTVTATYGFMERADLPALMTQIASRHGCPLDPAALTYFIGMERVTSRDDGQGVPRWIARAFALMLRNCTRVTDYLRVPADQVVDLGRQVSI